MGKKIDSYKQNQQQPNQRHLLRKLIRKYLLPIYQQQKDHQVTEIDQRIVKFIRKLKKILPLLPEDTSIQAAFQTVRKNWKQTTLSKEAKQYFTHLQQNQLGTINHSQALLNIAGSYLSAIFLLYHYQRAFRLYVNVGQLNNKIFLRNIIDGLRLLFRNHGQLFVGNKQKKKQLAYKAYRVLSSAYNSQRIHLGDDVYRYRD